MGRRVRSEPEALRLLKTELKEEKKEKKAAWDTMRRFQALPLVPIEMLPEAVKVVEAKAPEPFKGLIREFAQHYIVGKTVTLKNGKTREKPPA